MENEKALEIIKALADGVDPETGEVFPGDSVYQRADVIRALFAAKEALEKSAKRKRRRDLPERAGEPWEMDEDERLAEESENGMDLKAIAELHKRTRGAIGSRLERLGKMVGE